MESAKHARLGPMQPVRIRPGSIALFLLLLSLAAACSRARPKLVVWIEIDTLRADALGCYGNRKIGENGVEPSPVIDALAAQGVRFENAYSVAPWTIPSLVTQMSGRWPWEHGQIRMFEPCPEAYLPLVPALRDRGWRTAGVMANPLAKGDLGFSRGFERWDDSFARGHEGSTGEEAVARLLDFADELEREPGSGVLLFAWLFEPHYRYEAHAGYRFGAGYGDRASEHYDGPLTGAEDINDLLRRRGELTPADVDFLRGRYASEVAWVDRAVGELLSGLASRGKLDDALVVLVSDHGEEILDRNWIGHTVSLHEELVHVPLVMRLPAGVAPLRRGTTVAHPVSLIDLPATLFELATWKDPVRAGVDLGHSRSLAATILDGTAPERRWLYLHADSKPPLGETREERTVLQWGVVDAGRDLKWIVDHKVGAGERPQTQLYDLARDPREQSDLAADPKGVELSRPLRRLRGLVPENLEGRRGAPAVLPEEPWIRSPADLDGVGPAFPGATR